MMAGAFGAHALRAQVTTDRLDTWQTAAHYQLLHAVVLLALAAWLQWAPTPLRRWALRFFVAGICLFSGSLYLLVLLDITWLGAVTPIGGVGLILAWGMLLVSAFREHTQN